MLTNEKKQFDQTGEVYLRVKVNPRSAKNIITEIMEDETIKVNIASPPIKGKANQELIKFLAKEFAVLKKNIKIISGQSGKTKLIKIIK